MKAPSIFSVLMTLIVTRLTEAGYYKYNKSQYRQNITPFKCTEEGYHPDPHDCRIYYRCVNWGYSGPLTTFKFECGVGTVFSKDKGDICTHPGDSGRPECAGSENEIDSNLQDSSEIPSPIWTTKRTTTRPQPITTQTSVTVRPLTTTTGIITTTRKSETISQSSITNRPITESENTISNCQNKLQCSQEGFLSDNCDCRKFYRCVDNGFGKFIKYDFSCGVGTVWDPEIQGCNHAWAVVRKNCRQDLESENDVNIDEQWNGDNGQWNGDIGEPGQPGQVEDSSGQPGQSGYPNGQPGQPGDLNGQPGQSGYPNGQSGQPGDLNGQPGQSGYPNAQPGQPGDLNGQPGQSGYPNGQPGQPGDLNGQPGQSGYPNNQPGQPGDLNGQPGQSGGPNSQPGQSGDLNGQSGQPGSPGAPCSSETPGISETSNTPGSPGSPDAASSPSSSGNQPSTGICTKEGLFADPSDCRKFYRCVGDERSFIKYEFQCGTGTVWDSSIQTCNHAYAVPQCNQQSGLVTSTPDTSLNEVDSTNIPDTSKLPPAQSSESSIIPSPSSESMTDSTQSSILTTPASQTTSISYLPPASSIRPSSVTQVSESISYLPPTTQMSTSVSYLPPSSSIATTSTRPGSVSYLPPAISTSEHPESTSTLPSSVPSSVSSPQDGKSECTAEGFFANPSDCKKFYRCVQSQSGYQKYDFECGPGTAWDQSVETCNHIGQVALCSTASNEIDQSSKPITNPPSESSVTSSTLVTVSSQTTATTSSSTISISTESTTVTSTIDETSKEPSTQETDKTEISSSTTVVTTTSSSATLAPEKPEEIQMPESSSTESSSEPSSSSSSESSEESSSTESHVPDCTTRKPNNTIVCNKEGFYPNPTRCDKFYRCVDNGNGFNVYHFDCPPGTIFDPSINVCNYPESVYPARDCTSGDSASSTPSNVSAEPTTQPETPEQSSSTEITTAQSETQQTEESTTSGTESVTTAAENTTASSTELTTSETPESTESTTGSTSESTTTIATESATSEQTTEVTTEVTTSKESTESETSTESQEQSTTESQVQTTTESQETSSTEQSTTESQEQSTTESQEQSTTESQEQSTTESESTTTEPGTATPCAIGNLTDDQIALVCPTGFRKHPKYCNLFYQCTSEGNMEIKILVLTCPENTIFDEKKIQCLPEDRSSQPCTGAKASARFYRRLEDNDSSPMKVSSNALCPSEGHFPHRQGCSSTFYKCKRDVRNTLQGYLYKCPEDFVYWSVSRRCERATRLPMCSHLAYRNKITWHDQLQIPIEDFNLSARMLHSF